MAAAALGSRILRQAADAYDRAARAPYGRIPRPSPAGNSLRRAARLLAAFAFITSDPSFRPIVLITRLAALAEAVAVLRQSQQRAAQAASALSAAERLTPPRGPSARLPARNGALPAARPRWQAPDSRCRHDRFRRTPPPPAPKRRRRAPGHHADAAGNRDCHRSTTEGGARWTRQTSTPTRSVRRSAIPPSVSRRWSRWSPPQPRSRLSRRALRNARQGSS